MGTPAATPSVCMRSTLAGSTLAQRLVELKVGIVCRSDLEADFLFPPSTPVFLLSEAAMLRPPQELEDEMQGIFQYPNPVMLLQRTNLTASCFQRVMCWAVVKCGAAVIPVHNEEQVVRVLKAMAMHWARPPTRMPAHKKTLDSALVRTTRHIPSLSGAKAERALTYYGSIQALASASENEVTQVLASSSTGKRVPAFFREELDVRAKLPRVAWES